MARPKQRIFTVQKRDAKSGEVRLVRGTRTEVEGWLLGLHLIEPCTPEQAVELGAAGVRVEEAAA